MEDVLSFVVKRERGEEEMSGGVGVEGGVWLAWYWGWSFGGMTNNYINELAVIGGSHDK